LFYFYKIFYVEKKSLPFKSSDFISPQYFLTLNNAFRINKYVQPKHF
jgi:hypothetical protein